MQRHVLPRALLGPSTDELAQAIAQFAQTDGDYSTRVPQLSLHRRKGRTAPLHCIFELGLGVVAQGRKEALLGDDVIRYGPGQSMLTTIDLPVVSHVTHASAAEPLLGLMLRLDVDDVMRASTALDAPTATRPSTPCHALSVETLDPPLIDALVRLVRLLGEPELASRLAPLIRQEIVLRLLSGPHGPQLRRLAANGSPS